MKPTSLFLTGTDTGVGKTLVTALLVLHLRARGIDAGVMKPIASGCFWENGELKSEDALFLREMTEVEDELDLVNPIRYEEPLAPLVAARREAKTDGKSAFRDDIAVCMNAYQALMRRHECVVVEGVGGLRVPLQQERAGEAIQTGVDLANSLALPLVCVARRTLGTLNHTLSTCSVPLQAPARIAALVFCDSARVEPDDIAAQTSPELLQEITGLPIWGEIPFLEDQSLQNLREIASKLIRVNQARMKV